MEKSKQSSTRYQEAGDDDEELEFDEESLTKGDHYSRLTLIARGIC